MDIQTIKVDLIHWLTELEDKSVLNELIVLKEKQERSFELNAEQQKELDGRLEKYVKGEMEFSSWDTVKNRVRNRAKDVL